MERKNYSQLELFSKDYSEVKTEIPRSFLQYLCGYEKTILIIIGFIITGIISFSLGIERGKRITALKINSNMDMAQKLPASISNQIISQKVTKQDKYQPLVEKQVIIKPQEPKQDTESYTIQVASYQSKAFAEKEADKLKKKGLTPLVISKGKYIVVYVKISTDKETAKSLLTQLKKRYGDCILRRL